MAPPAVSAVSSCATGGACRAGDTGPGGGTVFHVAQTPQWWGTYMEAKPLSRGAGLPWSLLPTTSLFTGGDAARQVIDHTGIGWGRENTALITAQSGPTGSAAAYVDGIVSGGKSDWFLPSKDELNALYDHYALHGRPAMAKAPYWSSSENGPRYAFYQLFQDGTRFTDENGLGNVASNKQLHRMPVHRGSGFGALLFRIVAVRAFGPAAGTRPVTSNPQLTGRVCSVDGPCAVGDTGPGGGIVFYDAGEHKSWGRWLEMAPVETEFEGIPWKKLSVVDRQKPVYRDDKSGLARHKRVLSKAIGMGYANTKRIVRTYGAGNYSAWKAWELDFGGKTDWFLPSEDELNEAHRVLFTAVPTINTIRRSFYWSSSEYNYDTAWTVNMKDGQQFDREKWKVPDPSKGVKAIRTRAVRAFG